MEAVKTAIPAPSPKTRSAIGEPPSRKILLVRVLQGAMQQAGIGSENSILVLGGGNIDIVLLETVGLTNYTLSNLTSRLWPELTGKTKDSCLMPKTWGCRTILSMWSLPTMCCITVTPHIKPYAK